MITRRMCLFFRRTEFLFPVKHLNFWSVQRTTKYWLVYVTGLFDICQVIQLLQASNHATTKASSWFHAYSIDCHWVGYTSMTLSMSWRTISCPSTRYMYDILIHDVNLLCSSPNMYMSILSNSYRLWTRLKFWSNMCLPMLTHYNSFFSYYTIYIFTQMGAATRAIMV